MLQILETRMAQSLEKCIHVVAEVYLFFTLKNTVEPVPTGSSHYTDEAAKFEEEIVDGKFRFDSRLTLTRKLLDIFGEKKGKPRGLCLNLKNLTRNCKDNVKGNAQ